VSCTADNIGGMYEPMSRRLVISFAVIGVALFVAGLIARPVNITVAVWLFLPAVGVLGLAGYGVLDRVFGGRKRSAD
jgi:hypothetical protein